MTWLTWRLHRMEAAIGLPLFAGLIVIMLLAGQAVEGTYDEVTDAGCLGESSSSAPCNELWNDFYSLANRWDTLTVLIHGVPLAAAALLAIPTVQELERGTHRLAWTQSVSRRRWVLWRVGFVAVVAAVVAALWIPVAAAWRELVLRQGATTFRQEVFDLSPAVLVGYGLFAAALGLAAAVVVRRVIPTLAILAVGFIGTRVLTAFWLRERFRPPVEETVPAAEDPYGQLATFGDHWFLDEYWLTASGQPLSWERVYELCPPGADNVDYRQCLTTNGLQYYRQYQPVDRFGQFQLIELGLYLGLAAALLGFAFWWLTRRSA